MKQSFEPVADGNIRILILGSLPGEKSLSENEYYAHPHNRFWKIIAHITGSNIPSNYSEKTKLLLDNRMGLWDVARKAHREGSLDSNIKNEIPNKIDDFIVNHPDIEKICFNGKKAESMFFKFFEKKAGTEYVSLPSTSPANARYDFEELCRIWKQILVNI